MKTDTKESVFNLKKLKTEVKIEQDAVANLKKGEFINLAKVRKLVSEYKADPNCWPELWIKDEDVTPQERKLFIQLTAHNINESHQHTQGEWSLNAKEEFGIRKVTIKGLLIAKVFGYNDEEAEANAKLIETAPELLKKLIQANTLLKSRCLDTDIEMLDLNLDDTIKKATK